MAGPLLVYTFKTHPKLWLYVQPLLRYGGRKIDLGTLAAARTRDVWAWSMDAEQRRDKQHTVLAAGKYTVRVYLCQIVCSLTLA